MCRRQSYADHSFGAGFLWNSSCGNFPANWIHRSGVVSSTGKTKRTRGIMVPPGYPGFFVRVRRPEGYRPVLIYTWHPEPVNPENLYTAGGALTVATTTAAATARRAAIRNAAAYPWVASKIHPPAIGPMIPATPHAVSRRP